VGVGGFEDAQDARAVSRRRCRGSIVLALRCTVVTTFACDQSWDNATILVVLTSLFGDVVQLCMFATRERVKTWRDFGRIHPG
jgi:hypothetical protein